MRDYIKKMFLLFFLFFMSVNLLAAPVFLTADPTAYSGNCLVFYAAPPTSSVPLLFYLGTLGPKQFNQTSLDPLPLLEQYNLNPKGKIELVIKPAPKNVKNCPMPAAYVVTSAMMNTASANQGNVFCSTEVMDFGVVNTVSVNFVRELPKGVFSAPMGFELKNRCQ